MKCLISAKSPGDLREISRGGNWGNNIDPGDMKPSDRRIIGGRSSINSSPEGAGGRLG